MTGSVSRWWLGLLGLVSLGGIAQGQVMGPLPPVKINTVFKFQVEFKVGPDIKRPTAPWYAYFPHDPRMIPAPQTSPYPTWPQQFPPQRPPLDSRDVFKKLSAENVASGPMTHWPTSYVRGSALEPVRYVPALAPNYWYQNR